MTHTAMPPIVSREEWDAARAEMEKQEDALNARLKEVAAERRRLPMTLVDPAYTFTGAEGDVSLADVFGGATQLIVYHFMFAPEWEKGCPHCTLYARSHGAGINDVLGDRDTRYVLMSRAPYEKLAGWANEQGIDIPWYSCSREFMEDMGQINDSFGDFPGVSMFFKADDGQVYRSYNTTSGAVELTMPTTGMFQLTPWGLQEKGEDSPEGWPQRFDAM